MRTLHDGIGATVMLLAGTLLLAGGNMSQAAPATPSASYGTSAADPAATAMVRYRIDKWRRRVPVRRPEIPE